MDITATNSSHGLHFCGLREVQGSAAHQESVFARLFISAKDNPLYLLDPVRTERLKFLLGLRLSQKPDGIGCGAESAKVIGPCDHGFGPYLDIA